jgi:hypothetical protein
MSGRPYIEGVQKLKKEFQILNSTQDELRALLVEIETKNKRIKTLDVEVGKRHQKIKELMDEMDVSGPGNYGHEGRMFSLLMGLCVLKEEAPQ